MKKRAKIFAMCILTACLVAGCGEKESAERIRDVEFTVVAQDEVPEELAQIIEQKKEEGFQLTYQLEDYLYIAKGYGVQESSGFSISVEDLYLTKDTVVIDTEIAGPGEGQTVQQTPTYPYVVVKTEYIDKGVVFQ